MAVQTRIKLRRATAAVWGNVNPVLALGEPGLETDTGKEKRGDGVTAWNALAYHNPGGAIPQSQVVGLEATLEDKASKAYADAAVAAAVDAAPAALDTLNELAAALGDDANFAATVTNELASKAASVHTHSLAEITDYVEPVSTVLSDTAPSSPLDGTKWIKTSTFQEYVYFNSSWVEI